MEVTVLIPIWKRPDITRACFENLKRQQSKFKFNVVVVGSEGDVSENLTKEFGFTYLEFSNEFLGAKLNAGLKLCKGGVVVIGSDNFLSDSAFSYYDTIDQDKLIYSGVKYAYIFSTKHQALSLFHYKGQSFKSIGVGRIYTKAIIKACIGKLWDDNKRNGLDTSASERCWASGGKELITDSFSVIDVKHSHNLTSPEIFRAGERRNIKEIEKVFGEGVSDSILSLKYSSTVNHRIRVKPYVMIEKSVEIKLLKDVGKYKSGQTISQPRIRAKRLVKSGTAEYVEVKPKAEVKEIAPSKPAKVKEVKAELLTENKPKEDGKVSEQKPKGQKSGGKKGKK